MIACGIGLAVWIVGLPRSGTVDYDRARYDEIRRAIDADPRHLLGQTLDEASRGLRLEDVTWDDIALQEVPWTVRPYHFRGFSQRVDLQSLPAGIPPDRQGPWAPTEEERSRPVVLWIARQRAFPKIDGIGDREERMRRFWKAVDTVCERINAEMRRNWPGYDRKADGEADTQSTGA